MEITVNNEQKLICVWIPNAEKNDEHMMNKLQSMLNEYQGKKYRFVIFESGSKDLREGTADLLVHNKGKSR